MGLKCDEVLALLEDIFVALLASQNAGELGPGSTFHMLMGLLNETIKNNGSPYCIGDMMTVADFKLLGVVGFMKSGFKPHLTEVGCLEPNPNVASCILMTLSN